MKTTKGNKVKPMNSYQESINEATDKILRELGLTQTVVPEAVTADCRRRITPIVRRIHESCLNSNVVTNLARAARLAAEPFQSGQEYPLDHIWARANACQKQSAEAIEFYDKSMKEIL